MGCTSCIECARREVGRGVRLVIKDDQCAFTFTDTRALNYNKEEVFQ